MGFPKLAHVDALPRFKRVLTDGANAALTISPLAKKGFVAVELAGMAVVVSTRDFRETNQYATYLLDLEKKHVVVREEMSATEEVISQIYERARIAMPSVVKGASRAIDMFRDISEIAHDYKASDIHVEVREYEKDAHVRFRVNGDLYTYARLPRSAITRALAAAYQDLVQQSTNSASSFQPTGPQSAMIPLVMGKDIVNMRWQSLNINGGYDVALRLLDGNFKNYSVLMPEAMGWEAGQCEQLYATTRVNKNLTVACGPTGSGKTTLLRALSFALADRGLRKQFAISEPSEYPKPWLSDVSIQRRPGESEGAVNQMYVEVIRSMMRMDPDDISVEEIRDRVVAGLAVELAMTGHPVRTTVHGGSIVDVFMRLVGGRLQIPMDEIASGLVNAAICQNLVPVLCECSLPARDVMPQEQLSTLERKFGLDTSKMRCRNEDGCPHCRLEGLFTETGKVAAGTVGVTVVGEVYEPTDEFIGRIAQRDWRGAEAVYRSGRRTAFDDPDMTGKTMYEHALYKASGNSKTVIDPRVIHNTMGHFDRYRVQPISIR
jgi:type II secretory ATPase GspE/PulE/Tfp pilus assembly ATPase PilB-like protein